MKLMFYINTISCGGAERVMVNLSNQFIRKGHDVIFVTTYQTDQEYKLDNRMERKVLLERNGYNFIEKNLNCTWQLRKIIKMECPDVLISFMAEPNFRAVCSSLGLKTKNLISVRNDPDREYPNVLFKFCAKFLYRFADCVVFQTKDAQNWFSKPIQKKSCIIMNQVNDKFFQALPAEVHKDIVTVGRLVEQKNHEMLIRAFARIADKTDDNLIIYGDGDRKEALVKLVGELQLTDRVFFPGVISDVSGTVRSAKIFVLSSIYEGMPNALIEAMVLGLPCISTDCPCGGPRELFDGQKNGFLVPIGDENALAKKMLYLIENESVRAELGNCAKETAQQFSPEVVFECWEAVIARLAEKQA